ncbi:MAG: permease [Candidatus Udaeobacter sp.]
MDIAAAVGLALWMAFAMFWEILWPLILGFGLSAVVQAVVSKSEMTKLLPDDSPKSLAIACALGAASSSCSYAAVALARSIFRKGANFTAAMAFQLASTNLVAELTIIIIVLMGWQFATAEFLGGLLMVVLMALLFRMFLSNKLVAEASAQAEKGFKGKMEGHAEMDMSVTEGSLWERIRSKDGFTATSHYFVMDLAAVWKDIAVGLLIAGALAAWVPADFWQKFFLVSHPVAARIWGPIVGPIVAIFSFVCSVGNVPLAAVLWNGGISFGGVIAFIYADLIILPIIDIYRKYYGWKVAGLIVAGFYVAMVGAALLVELFFNFLGISPSQRSAQIVEMSISFNYTTVLNIIFRAVAALLLVRFFRTGGPKMLAHME